LADIAKRIDRIGEPGTEPHVPVAWAWAMAAPLQWTKQVASHFGGTRNPLVVHWPKGIKAKGELRTQFHHVIDIAPTILEACQVAAPKTVNGIPQKPIEGVSMRYSFDDARAKSRRTTQYFEMFANRAIYHDGWVACSRFDVPWNTLGRTGDFLKAPWELYHIENDFSEADDLAAKEPAKLRELQVLFAEEAKKYDVFPLDGRFAERGDPRNRVAGERRTSWTYYGNKVSVPEMIGPIIYPASHTVTADLAIPEQGCEGVIAAAGGIDGGWSLYVLDGKLIYHYNLADFEHFTVQFRAALEAHELRVRKTSAVARLNERKNYHSSSSARRAPRAHFHGRCGPLAGRSALVLLDGLSLHGLRLQLSADGPPAGQQMETARTQGARQRFRRHQEPISRPVVAETQFLGSRDGASARNRTVGAANPDGPASVVGRVHCASHGCKTARGRTGRPPLRNHTFFEIHHPLDIGCPSRAGPCHRWSFLSKDTPPRPDVGHQFARAAPG